MKKESKFMEYFNLALAITAGVLSLVALGVLIWFCIIGRPWQDIITLALDILIAALAGAYGAIDYYEYRKARLTEKETKE